MVLGTDTQDPRNKIDKIFELGIRSEGIEVTNALSIGAV